ncbi:MAG: flagellar brake protein [Clostridiales bacterium]|nr:flagellar brake protein [Clostridiales bacterium]
MENEKSRYSTSLKIGERIGISLDGEIIYPTLLEDITEDNHLIISVPLYRGIPIIMKVEQHVQFFFFRDNGRFCIDVQVEEIIMRGPLRLISLLQLTEPHKQQRRESFRLRIGLSALIRPFSGKQFPPDPFFVEEDMAPWEEVLTNNLSETGLSFNSIIEHKSGDYLHLKVTLDHSPEHMEQIELLGLVRQSQAIDYLGRQYRLGVEFLPYSENLRQLIAKFVLKKQQQVIRAELDFDLPK